MDRRGTDPKPLIIGLIFTAVFGLSNTASALNNDKSPLFGVKAGLVLPGTITVENGRATDYDTDTGVVIGGFVDSRLGAKLDGGFFVDLSNVPSSDAGESATRLDLGVTLKGHFLMSSGNLILRPGIGLGLGLAKAGGESGVHLLTLNGFVEAIFPFTDEMSWLGEIGFTTAPTGGNGDVWVTHGPIFELRGGIVF